MSSRIATILSLAPVVTALSLAAPADATTLVYLPSGGYSQSVSANVPQYGNVWSGVAQSITALDSRVSFGFYMFSPTSGVQNITYTLFDGNGIYGNILSTKSASFQGGSYNPVLVSVDFSSINLNIGGKYTFAVSMTSGPTSSGNYSTASIAYASLGNYDNVDDSVYSGGRFYFLGSPYNSASYWIDRDIAFSMSGVSSGVPEPANWGLMIIGFGAAGATLRRRRRSASALQAA